MRWLVVLLASLPACKPSDTFRCLDADQCRLGEEAGFCEAKGLCSFIDLDCPSGHRYDESAGALGNTCVEGVRARRIVITIDGTKVAGPVSDFPVWIDLTDAELGKHARADGGDLELTTADGAAIPYEIQRWDAPAGHLMAWVKLARLDPGTDTTINLRYVAPRSSEPNGPLVFSNGFAAVWHLDDSLATTAIADATATHAGVANGTHPVAAQLGGGLDFNGVADEITFTNPLVSNTNHTISAWVDARTSVNYGSIVTVGNPATNASRWFHTHFFTPDVAVGFYGNDWIDTGTNIEAAGPTLVHWVFDTATLTSSLYRDGALVGTFVHSNGVDTKGTAGHLGNAPIEWGPSNNATVPLAGTLDEVRIAVVPRSAGWVATEYANQHAPATFYRAGGEELVP